MSFRMRWWMWVVAVMLVLLSALIALRIAGMRRLQEVRHELGALGLPTDPVAYVALAPPVDEDRQQRIGRYVLYRASSWGGDWPVVPFSNLAEQRLSTTDQARLDSKLAAGRMPAAEVGAILDEGPVVLSLLGFCPRDPTRLASMGLAEVSAMPLPGLLQMRDYANWWAQRACLDDDPEPHLRHLDQWQEGLRRPGSLIDAMISIACSRMRDDAHLWLATRGRLSAQRLERWLAEAPEQRRWCADGFASERSLFWDPIAHMPLLPDPTMFGGGWDLGWQSVAAWPLLGYECAYAQQSMANTELVLRRQPPIAVQPMPFHYSGIMSAIMLPNLQESGITAIEAENGHRMLRLCAVIAVLHRRSNVLPDVAELPAALLAGRDADLPPLRYETFPPHRFRIGIDPAGPLPPSIPAARWTPPHYASAIGSPPVKTPVSPARRWSIEIDLDAILIPPPEKPAKVKATK